MIADRPAGWRVPVVAAGGNASRGIRLDPILPIYYIALEATPRGGRERIRKGPRPQDSPYIVLDKTFHI
jgi:hypothetical protein